MRIDGKKYRTIVPHQIIQSKCWSLLLKHIKPTCPMIGMNLFKRQDVIKMMVMSIESAGPFGRLKKRRDPWSHVEYLLGIPLKCDTCIGRYCVEDDV
jgi:hypothetical protein